MFWTRVPPRVIPIQDTVPSGKMPLVTIALIVMNSVWFAIQSLTSLPQAALALSPFSHATVVQFFINVLFLWLFGDNVEARVGRLLFAMLYVLCGAIRAYAAVLTGHAGSILLGASSGVSGVLGALSCCSRIRES